MLDKHIAENTINKIENDSETNEPNINLDKPIDDRTSDDVKEDDTNLYDISNFSV